MTEDQLQRSMVRRPHKYRAIRQWMCPKCALTMPYVGKLKTPPNCLVCNVSSVFVDSKSEAKRYAELIGMQKRGEITDLRRQVRYPLAVDGRPVLIRSQRYPNGRQVSYVCDFTYRENDEPVIEDRKGFWTTEAKLKVAFFEAQYGVRVRITGAAA